MTNLVKLILLFQVIALVARAEPFKTFPTLQSGNSISQGFYLSSGNGYYAVLQRDGNFNLYSSMIWTPSFQIWSSGTPHKGTPPYRLILQDDGNLVTYDAKNKVIWATGTENKGKNPYRLVLQQDRNLVLYDANNTPMWATHTRIE